MKSEPNQNSVCKGTSLALLNATFTKNYDGLVNYSRNTFFTKTSIAEDIVNDVYLYFYSSASRVPDSETKLIIGALAKIKWMIITYRKNEIAENKRRVPFDHLDNGASLRTDSEDIFFEPALGITPTEDEPKRPDLQPMVPPSHVSADTDAYDRDRMTRATKFIEELASDFLTKKHVIVLKIMIANQGEHLTEGQIFDELTPSELEQFYQPLTWKPDETVKREIGRYRCVLTKKISNRFGTSTQILESPMI